jgi:hypothetical protein
MFDQTFIEATQSDRKPVTVVFSLAFQGFFICLLILIQLLYTEALPGAVTKSLLVAPAPPQAAVHESPTLKIQPKLAARAFDPRKLVSPVVIPKQIHSSPQAAPAPEVAIVGSAGDANGSGAPGIIGSILGSVP